MPDISTRINALITYLFLGPIILFARPGTPLAHPYVRGHAKKASLIILSGIGAFIAYIFLKGYFTLHILSFSLESIMLTIIVTLTLFILIHGAYKAFNGVTAEESTWKSFHIPENTIQEGVYTEEDKIRIIASFIPFIGIVMANKYPIAETLIGRKIGSIFMFILLTSILFFHGSITTFTLIITLIYIALIVTTTVYLFGFSRFLNFNFYEHIPTYLEFDAHIKASIVTIYDFFRIAFGGIKHSDYQTQYGDFLKENQSIRVATVPYFAPLWIIAIPLINLITLPSLRQSQYREYTPMILQGFFITFASVIVFLQYGIGSQMGLYLLFLMMTIIVEGQKNILVRAPLSSIIVDLYQLMNRTQLKIENIKKEGEKKVSHTYEVKEDEN